MKINRLRVFGLWAMNLASSVFAASSPIPLSDMLDAQGQLQLPAHFKGNLDPQGFQLVSQPNEPPRFKSLADVSAPQNLLTNSATGNWIPFGGLSSCSGTVRKMVQLPNGDWVVGGTFSKCGGVSVRNVARWDGKEWYALGLGSSNGVNNSVADLAVIGTDVYVGGYFNEAGGVPVNNIARWNGTTWSALGSGVNGSVYTLVSAGTHLFVGGGFSSAGGVYVGSIAEWDGNSWHALGSGVEATGSQYSYVKDIAVSGNDIYIGGFFTNAGGQPANSIARWNGSAWFPLSSGVQYESQVGSVFSMAVKGSEVYVGGFFTQAGGQSANYIARWDGINWSGLGTGLNERANDITVWNNDIYIAGNFTLAGGQPAHYVAHWNDNTWLPLGNGLNWWGDALAVSNDCLYIGGGFSLAGGSPAKSMACWDGNQWSAFAGSVGESIFGVSDASISAVAVLSEDDVYVGGSFTHAGTLPVNRIAHWDGKNWSALGNSIDGWVETIAPVSKTEVYVGGWLSQAEVSFNGIARWDGTQWSSLGDGVTYALTGSSGVVNTILITGNSTQERHLYAGGSFTQAGGQAANNIARWDGAHWYALGAGIEKTDFHDCIFTTCPPIPVPVRSLLVYNGQLYAGGLFNVAGGQGANNIARWDGAHWYPLGSGVDNAVYAGSIRSLAAFDGFIYAGGAFANAGGQPSPYLARWDGNNWFPVGAGINGPINTLSASGNVLYVGGQFSQAGGQAANNIAQWDGTGWYSLAGGTEDTVRAIAVNGSEIYVGGDFSTTDGKLSSRIGLWSTDRIFSNGLE